MSNEQHPDLISPYSVPELSPTIKPLAPEPKRRLSKVANVLLGLGLLLTGLPLAWLLGIGTARVIAAPSKRMPLQEILLRRTNRVITEIYRLPGRWQPTPPLETRIEPVPIPTQPIAPLTKPPAALNQRERQLAEEELTALQQEFETIRKRLFDLESKLGQAQSTADVESRLSRLEQRLKPQQEASLAPPSENPETLTPENIHQSSKALSTNASATSQHPLLETTELKIVLPSDALFASGEARLLATAPDLLSRILADLTQYPHATMLISAHSDDRMEPAQSISLTFQQANALRAYLGGHLPDYRWITMGYGQNQPLNDNSTAELRQRNRRIEIAIDRR